MNGIPATDPAAMSHASAEYRQLLGMAYRMLGSLHEAQDAVQDGLERWIRLPAPAREQIDNPQAWLVRVVSRHCLDLLGSARVRREAYPGWWLPEPVLGTPFEDGTADPERLAEMADSVSVAMLHVMERLSPVQRVCFVLHDVFAFPYAEIAGMTDRTAAACRQAASAARAALSGPAGRRVTSAERAAVVAAFRDACAGGDIDRLAAVLAPGVVSVADGGRAIHAARKPVVGAERVAAYLLAVLDTAQRDMGALEVSAELVNGRTGIVVRAYGTVVAVADLEIADGLVTGIALIVAPEKLTPTG